MASLPFDRRCGGGRERGKDHGSATAAFGKAAGAAPARRNADGERGRPATRAVGCPCRERSELFGDRPPGPTEAWYREDRAQVAPQGHVR